jgi:hypothetical protein
MLGVADGVERALPRFETEDCGVSVSEGESGGVDDIAANTFVGE